MAQTTGATITLLAILYFWLSVHYVKRQQQLQFKAASYDNAVYELVRLYYRVILSYPLL